MGGRHIVFMFEKAGSEGPEGCHAERSSRWLVIFPKLRRKTNWNVLSVLETVAGRWQRKPWELVRASREKVQHKKRLGAGSGGHSVFDLQIIDEEELCQRGGKAPRTGF